VISDILSQLEVAKKNSNSALIELSYSTAIDWLSNTDVIEDFLTQYAIDYIPAGSNWRLTRINKEELRRVLAGSRVFITRKITEGGPSIVGRSAKIDSFSFCSILCAEIGCRLDLYFYGDVTDLCDHVAAQLLHVGTVWDHNVGLFVNFLPHIQFDKVESCLSDIGLTKDKIEPFFDQDEAILGVRQICL